MNNLEAIALGEPSVGMLRPWHDLFIALDGNQNVREP